MKEIENIENIRHRFRGEWLLIGVDEVDEVTGEPLKGHLIDHDKSSDTIWNEAGKHLEPVMVLFSDDWPEDMAACFSFVTAKYTCPRTCGI